jgi:MFS transporter, DHA2 family, methylenomycin A resistance protein
MTVQRSAAIENEYSSARGGVGTTATLTLVATCLGLFLGQVDTTAVNLALPAMSRDLSGGIAGMQWVIDAYNVTYAALLLTGGTLGDRLGRRRLFRAGIAVFLLGSITCALAPSLPIMLGGRVLQGAGSASMIPQSLAILATAFPGRRERNRAMAAWSMVAGLGLAAGPTLGGLVVQEIGWQFIFWVNVPLGLGALLLAFRYVPESRNENAREPDVLGQVFGALALGLVTFVIVEGNTQGWASATILGCAVAAVICVAIFLRTELTRRSPMLPLRLMRRGQLPVASVVALCMTFGMYAMFMLMSLDFQQERGASAIVSGLEMLPLPAAFVALSPLVGRLVTRIGPRLPMTAGMALMGAGLLIYAVVGGNGSLLLTEVAFVIVGIGLSLNTGPVVGVAVSAVASEWAGLASGIANLSRMFGAALGVAVQGAVLAAIGHGATHGAPFLSGLRDALLVGCVVELFGAVVALVKVKNRQPAAAASDRPAVSRTDRPASR